MPGCNADVLGMKCRAPLVQVRGRLPLGHLWDFNPILLG